MHYHPFIHVIEKRQVVRSMPRFKALHFITRFVKLMIGDKLTFLIIRDMLYGKCYYKDFCQSPEKIAANIPADRLGKLVEYGIAEKWIPDEESGREAYRLTAMGQSLETVLESVAMWGLSSIKGTDARLKSNYLLFLSCLTKKR